jgi:hypothetical protein
VHRQPAAVPADDGKKLSVAAQDRGCQVVEVIEQAVADSLNRLLLPSLKRELRAKLTEQAEQQAISIFARNVENILIAPPVRCAPPALSAFPRSPFAHTVVGGGWWVVGCGFCGWDLQRQDDPGN